VRAPERGAGAALILVVVVIAALLAIAAPFLISMNLHERSAVRFAADVRARQVAAGARAEAVARLADTHPDGERRRRVRAGDLVSDPEGVDDLAELAVDLRPERGLAVYPVADPQDALAHVEVMDLRALVDLNTCGPVVVGNLLGSTVTAAPLGRDDEALAVADATPFFSDGDPDSLDGLVTVGAEIVGYRHATRTALLGLERRLGAVPVPVAGRRSTAQGDDAAVPTGALVQDARAWKVALDPVWRHLVLGGERLPRFANVAAVRRTADWSLAAAALSVALLDAGVTGEVLRGWRLDGEALAAAGVLFWARDPDPRRADDRRALREAEGLLHALGVEAGLIRRFGGWEAVVREHAALADLEPEARAEAVAGLKARLGAQGRALAEVEAAARERVAGFLGRDPRLLAELAEVETIGRIELEEDLRPFAAVDALPEGEGWSEPQPVDARVELGPTGAAPLLVQDPRRFVPGQVVVVRPRGGDGAPAYRVALARGGYTPPLEASRGAQELLVSCRQPRPVNVNTAPRRVLEAVLTGVASSVHARAAAEGDERAADDFVRPGEARAIAAALIRARPLATPRDLKRVLLDLRAADAIGDHDVDAVYRNAIDPGDPLLTRPTVPFCYRSGDGYRIDARGAVGNAAREEVARAAFREVVRVAPPRELVWTIDSQADFTDRLYHHGPPRGGRDPLAPDHANPLFLPGRWSAFVQTRPVHLGPYAANPGLLPSRSHAPGEGDLRPLLAREPDLARGTNEAPLYTVPPPPPPPPPPSETTPRPTPTGGGGGGYTPPPTPPPPPPPPPDFGDELPPPIEQVRRPALPPAWRGAVLLPAGGRFAAPRWRLPVRPAPVPRFGSTALDPSDVGRNEPPPPPGGIYVVGGPEPGALLQERWDERLDGEDLAGARIAADALAKRWFPREDWVAQEGLGPGLVRFWLRIDSLPAPGERAFLFDGGEAEGRNRLALYLDGPREVVFAAWDETLDALETGGRPRATELRHRFPAPLEVGVWYHVACLFKGSDRGDLALLWDGRPVGEPSLGSRLREPIDAWTTRIPVEDASRFPPEGWVRVGVPRWDAPLHDRGLAGTGLDSGGKCEVLRYTRIVGDDLIVDRHQVRGWVDFEATGGALKHVEKENPDPDEFLPLEVPDAPRRARQPRRGSGHRYWWVYVPDGLPPVDEETGVENEAKVADVLGYPHDAGTYVVPYGYRSWVKSERGGDFDTIRVGGATLRDPLPPHTPATLLYAKQDDYDPADPDFDPLPPVVDAAATELPVLWAARYPDDPRRVAPPARPPGAPAAPGPPPANVTGGFPPAGVVRITSFKRTAAGVERSVERIAYSGVDAGRGLLLGCTRGVGGTDPAPHFLFDPVVLESIRVDDPSDYPGRRDLEADGRVYVSLETNGRAEWLSVQKPTDPNLREFLLIPPVDSLAAARGGPGAALAAPSGYLPVFPHLGDLLRYMREQEGDLGGQPGLLRVRDPRSVDFGQPFAEVLKRWDAWGVARARKGSARPTGRGHPAGTKVVPTFAVRGADARESGPGDVVTVSDDADGPGPRVQRRGTRVRSADPGGPPVAREEQTVAHGAPSATAPDPALPGRTWVGDRFDGWLVAFDDFVSRPYRGDRGARLARWPVGDLSRVPDLTLGRARPPGPDEDEVAFAPGVLEGRIDDLVSLQLPEVVYAFPVDAEQEAGLGRGPSWRPGQLYLGDGELIGVTKAERVTVDRPGTWWLLALHRGALWTAPRRHSRETPLWRIDWPAATVLNGPAPEQARTIRVHSDRGFGRFGYAAVDAGRGRGIAELLPYDEVDGVALRRPPDRLGRGAFRGAFGTGRAALRNRALLVDFPFRAHDRYADGVDSLQGVFFQATRELPNAFVTRVTWDEALPSRFADVRVAVRIDGRPGWDGEVARGPGERDRIYLFDDPDAENLVGVAGDRVEVRVYPTFHPGAFAAGRWKEGAVVGAVRVAYRQQTTTVRREVRTD